MLPRGKWPSNICPCNTGIWSLFYRKVRPGKVDLCAWSCKLPTDGGWGGPPSISGPKLEGTRNLRAALFDQDVILRRGPSSLGFHLCLRKAGVCTGPTATWAHQREQLEPQWPLAAASPQKAPKNFAEGCNRRRWAESRRQCRQGPCGAWPSPQPWGLGEGPEGLERAEIPVWQLRVVASGGYAALGTGSDTLQWFEERALEPEHRALKSSCKTYPLCDLATKPLGASAPHPWVGTDDRTHKHQAVGIGGKIKKERAWDTTPLRNGLSQSLLRRLKH